HGGWRTLSPLEGPVDVERPVRSCVLGEERRDTPRSRQAHRAGIEGTVGTSRLDTHGSREAPLDLRIHEVRPVALDADQRRARWLLECVIRIVAALARRELHLLIARLAALPRVDLAEPESQSAAAGEQHRQIRRIDL